MLKAGRLVKFGVLLVMETLEEDSLSTEIGTSLRV